MFTKKRIAVCTQSSSTMSASIFLQTRRGLTFEKRIEPTTFASLASAHHISHVRILLSEDDTYLKLLQFPKGIVVTRELVNEQIQGVIPEPVENAYMDWKIVSTNTDGVHVQVFVIKQAVLAPLLKAAHDASITIEACEPPSLAMARLTKHIKESFLLVYPPVKPLYLAAVSGGRVLEVTSIDPLRSLEDAKRACVAYVAKLWGVTLTAIATDMPNPIMGLAAKTDFQGEDMDVLNIPSVAATNKPFVLPLPLIAIVVALFVMVGTFSLVRYLGIQTTTKGKEKTLVAQEPIATPTPTEKPIQRDNLAVEVQNGTGEAGYANKGKILLEDLGYTNVETANADTFDYEGVVVKAKTSAIAAFIAADLKGTYNEATVSSTFLDNASSLDGIVILGKETAL